ncbi:serine protease FAM111A-like [Toxotes jaculatrix]|uniref:serine protease FAM111A-like n=1 Tax=Toxotes jaculatrix TaxID=941984 RepID=UPI001B3A7EE2|nr:serine protease FAM111A-like [Toxotes jaculatrix]XP_040906794.1 serine protease FAM111A-like [Toxotes jaculatrix]
MEPMLKTKNEGPMDRTVKNKSDSHNGESSQSHSSQLVAKKGEPHPTHSFEWCLNGKGPTSVTCNKTGTVEDSLRRSSQFRKTVEKNKGKELVILRHGKAISSHFPCSLIKNERLTVRYVKTKNMSKPTGCGSVHPSRQGSSDELVIFNVLAKGGKDVVKILTNPELRKFTQEITVYAYKGERVKQALRRDGRFLNIIFKKYCVLSHAVTEVTTEMSNLVDDLDGKTYKIIQLSKSSPPDSQPGSLDDAYMMPSDTQRSDSDEKQDPSQEPATTGSENDSTVKELNGNTAPEKMLREITDSERMQNHLSSQFKHSVKGMKDVSKLSRIQNLLRVEYGKNVQTCMEVKTMKKLMDLRNSVCQVRINGSPGGSGFLLFDNFVLTNCHVLEGITGKLYVKVTVHFSYESLDHIEGGQELGSEVEVEEVTAFEYSDASGTMYDWALLRLRANQELPDCLLTHFGFLPQSGGICIIGHPDGGLKKIDACAIVPSHDHNRVVAKHYHENQENIQLVTQRFFERVAEYLPQNRQVLTYESCFYFGSSGSPVFDKHCKVVAMHSGGYAYRNARGQTQSVIEYGYPLSNIIEHMILQLVFERKFDVLKAYLTCSFAHHQDVMNNVKKLVEGRNLTQFKKAVSSLVATPDNSLKMFFEFFSQKEEPIPMDEM